jgi:hypothetical protein
MRASSIGKETYQVGPAPRPPQPKPRPKPCTRTPTKDATGYQPSRPNLRRNKSLKHRWFPRPIPRVLQTWSLRLQASWRDKRRNPTTLGHQHDQCPRCPRRMLPYLSVCPNHPNFLMLTGVYAPTRQRLKHASLRYVSRLMPSLGESWSLLGAFNMIYRARDKSNTNISLTFMSCFLLALDHCEL